MPLPTAQQVHIDVGLTDVSIQFRNAEFIAEKFLRAKMVGKISDKIWVYGKDMFRLQNTKRAPGSRGPEGDWSLSTINYVCQEQSWTEMIPDQNRDNADAPLSLEVDATEVATAVIQLRLEYDTAVMLTTASNYASNLSQDMSAAGNMQWSDPASDPIADIQAAMVLVLESCGRKPNVMALGEKVFIALKNHPKLIDRVKYGGMAAKYAGQVTLEAIAELCGFEEVLEAQAVYDTAVEGTTASFNFIWGNNAILAVRPSAIGIKTLALAAIIRLNGYRRTESWYQQPESSTFIRVRDFYQAFPVSNLAGYLFQNCVKAGA